MTCKLYFRYGAMNSSKTANLLMVAHNYKQQGKKAIVIKPKIDIRFESRLVKSRCGLECVADFVIDKNDSTLEKIDTNIIKESSVILVDEAQFLTTDQVNRLRVISLNIPVICYGLRTDYKTNLFEGSKRLLEIADTIEEIKTICYFCTKKAIINLKHVDGKIVKEGSDEYDLGTEEKYLGSCWSCWFSKTKI